jgi:predicted acetyltransferase
VLLTYEQTNEASRNVIEANGRQPDGIADGDPLLDPCARRPLTRHAERAGPLRA